MSSSFARLLGVDRCYRNRPFVDGNRRTALVVALAFLDLNGIEFDAPQEEVFLTIPDLAAGRLTEAAFAAWLERHTASAK
ncbi:MAG: type II toxin-antitoxin system death-on-curing family toxin [Acidobacteriaceae bacterium]